ncbi:MAG: HD-GYP domain-containing protein [Oscillospiraceae bacterium]|nr:HD-GYP domain-containing protein [Oscillospiraceae bacterium]
MKKKISKDIIAIILTAIAYVVTFAVIAAYYCSVKNESNNIKEASLSSGAFNGDIYSLSDFDVKIGPRGGDSGAWLKDPILDDDGNELHGASVGIIYEMVINNTSDAVITDWTADVYMPEFMWINNGWNGKVEFHQTTTGKELTQMIDLREYQSVDIELDYYIDHTGPMIPLEKGDRFVYLPSKADNEFPLDPVKENEEVNDSAIIGFIVYIPDQGLDYAAVFDNVVFHYHLQKNAWSDPVFITLVGFDIAWLVILIGLVMSHIRVLKLLKQKKHDAQIIEQSIKTFINFVEAKDPNTKGHSERVAEITYALADEMGYDSQKCNNIRCIALMHDCGKIAIPVNILQKPAKLTDEEYETIKRHTTVGGEMLRDFTSIKDMSMGALYHHERYDGKGYPHGLKGEEIPLIARMICVADSLDAMNSNRCYRPKLTKEVIIDELVKNKGKQFDPEIVDRTLKLIKQGVINIGE